jgi:hypothetical protein
MAYNGGYLLMSELGINVMTVWFGFCIPSWLSTLALTLCGKVAAHSDPLKPLQTLNDLLVC